jgi:hypothetical protein
VTTAIACPIANHDREFADFINTWIELKRKDRTIASLFDYWILGRVREHAAPRWSIVRDVLHWAD